MNLFVRYVSLAMVIASALAYPNTNGAQSPHSYSSFHTLSPETTATASSKAGGSAIGTLRARGARDGKLRDVQRLDLSIGGAAFASSAPQRTALQTSSEPYRRNADYWKRARIIGYTLGVIAVGFAAFVAYSVVTGT